jgi:hypothetical protein
MDRIAYLLGCILALIASGAYCVTVGQSSRDFWRFERMPDAALVEDIAELESLLAQREIEELRHKLNGRRVEQYLRRYVPGWADGRRR